MNEEMNVTAGAEMPNTEQQDQTKRESKRMSNAGDFRRTATLDQLQELADYLDSQPHPSKSLPCPDRGWEFSYGFASTLLRDKGIWSEPEHEEAKSEVKQFILDPIPKGAKSTTRSCQIYTDVNERLNAFIQDKEGYTAKAIISQIISEGLKIYGG